MPVLFVAVVLVVPKLERFEDLLKLFLWNSYSVVLEVYLELPFFIPVLKIDSFFLVFGFFKRLDRVEVEVR